MFQKRISQNVSAVNDEIHANSNRAEQCLFYVLLSVCKGLNVFVTQKTNVLDIIFVMICQISQIQVSTVYQYVVIKLSVFKSSNVLLYICV